MRLKVYAGVSVDSREEFGCHSGTPLQMHRRNPKGGVPQKRKGRFPCLAHPSERCSMPFGHVTFLSVSICLHVVFYVFLCFLFFFLLDFFMSVFDSLLFSTTIKGNHHLQGNVQVYNVRIPVVLSSFVFFVCIYLFFISSLLLSLFESVCFVSFLY